MKAISLWQPWASLVAHQLKRVETRSWGTRYRGPLAIHAAERPMDLEAIGLLESLPEYRRVMMFSGRQVDISPACLPLGVMLAVVELKDCRPMGKTMPEVLRFINQHKLDEESDWELRFGHYDVGRFAWFLGKPKRLEPAVPAIGRQGLWEWDESQYTMQPRMI